MQPAHNDQFLYWSLHVVFLNGNLHTLFGTTFQEFKQLIRFQPFSGRNQCTDPFCCAFCDPYGILQRIQYSAYSQDMCTCITVGSKQQTQRFSTQLLTTDTNCCWFQASEFRETRYFAFRSQVHNMLRKALINGINCSAIHPAWCFACILGLNT